METAFEKNCLGHPRGEKIMRLRRENYKGEDPREKKSFRKFAHPPATRSLMVAPIAVNRGYDTCFGNGLVICYAGYEYLKGRGSQGKKSRAMSI